MKTGRIVAGIISVIGSAIYLLIAWVASIVFWVPIYIGVR